jgi:glycosyltransferase involved in cell wall biosynthesis
VTRCAFNLYGHLSSSVGLGAAARNTAFALDALGVPFDSVNVVPMPPPGQQAMDPALRVLDAGVRPRREVNLFHLNPNGVRDLLNSPYGRRVPVNHFNASVPFWELSELPTTWLEVLSAMDAVLAPSRFLQGIIERTIPQLPVLHFPQGIHLPQDVDVDRDKWGFAPGTTVFVCSFDLSSDMTRKNPLGVIAAFRMAFGDSDDARLVVRVNHAERADLASDMEALSRAAGGSVRLLTGPMSYDDVLSLYASADVYVSLHRAEGLGLGMLEAMALGRPVIATAYSGNMDFMDESVGMLIGFRMVPVTASLAYDPAVIGDGQQWAEPNLDDAAAAMRTLHDDPPLRQQLGALGSAKAAQVNAEHESGAVFSELCSLAADTPSSSRRSRQLWSLTADARRDLNRHRVVSAMRALKLKPPAPADERRPVYPVVTGPEGLLPGQEAGGS